MNSMDILRQLVASKTIWGVLILLLNNTVLKSSPVDDVFGEQAAAALTAALDAVGALLAVWGRLTAGGPMVALYSDVRRAPPPQ